MADETLIFPYWEEKSPIFGTINRPIVKAILNMEADPLIHYFYLDSGADISLLPLSVGEYLGLVKDEQRSHILKGVGSAPITAQIETIDLKLGPFALKVRFAWAWHEDVPSLLGRIDIFDCFEVTFQPAEKISKLRWLGKN